MVRLSDNNSNNVNLNSRNNGNLNLNSNNDTDINANMNGNSQRAKSWAVGEGLIDGVDYSAKHYAQLAQDIEQEIAGDTNNAHIWAEGTDAQVEALGGTHSSKGWVDYVLTNPPLASIEQTETGATITITDINGTTTADISNGTDGTSPSASIEQTATGATITITDAEGTTTADITNGTDGADGTNAEITGATASVTNTVGTPSVTVTAGGTSQARTFDFAFTNLKGETGATGQTGATGADGYSPTATVTKLGSTATITITDKNGTTTATVSDGTSGSSSISTLTDVSLSSLSNGQGLLYNSLTQKWENATISGGGGTVDQTFNSLSANAQSGVAIYGALTGGSINPVWDDTVTIGGVTLHYDYTDDVLYSSSGIGTSNLSFGNGYWISLETDELVLSSAAGQEIRFLNTGGIAVDTTQSGESFTYNGNEVATTADLSGFIINTATGNSSITINGTATAKSQAINIGTGSQATGNYGTALGAYSFGNASHAVGIGNYAKATADYAIQLNKGTNNTSNSLCVGFNSDNYQLLDGTTGLIPDARISDNIARTSDLDEKQNVLTAGTDLEIVSGGSLVPLPSGYTQIEYITTDGTAYIDTGITVAETDTLDFSFTDTSTPTTVMFITGRNGSDGQTMYFVSPSSSLIQWKGRPTGVTLAKGLEYNIVLKSGEVTYTNVYGTTTKTFTGGAISDTGTCLIGAGRSGATTIDSRKFIGNISKWQIKDSNNDLRFNGVPCYNSNNVYGLYDTVSDTFFPSIGANDFTGGNEVVAGTVINFTNTTGYITGINSTDVTTALGYTPVDKAGDTMTGDLTFKISGLDLGTTVSSNRYYGIEIQDTNGYRVGRLEGFQKTDGSYGVSVGTKVYGASTYPKLDVWVDSSDISHSSFPKTTCCDGQWVSANETIFTNVSPNGSGTNTYSLSSYLPNDGNNYECLLSSNGETGTTNGNYGVCYIGSSLTGDNYVCLGRATTRSASSITYGGACVIPVGTNRNIYLQKSTSYTGKINLYLKAYRRIGTNS